MGGGDLAADGPIAFEQRALTTGPRSATEYSFQPSKEVRVTLLLPKIASPSSET